MTHLLTQEQIVGVLADDGFYNWDLIQWFIHKKVFFIIRGRVNAGVKPLVQKHQEELYQKETNSVVGYRLNKGHTRKQLPIKLALCQTGDHIMALIVPPVCILLGIRIYEFYRQCFTIETYYR